MEYKVKGEKIHGIFIRRLNRFEAEVLVDGNIEIAHVPNSGRLKELLIEGNDVVLSKSLNERRKTKYSLLFVKKGDKYIYIYSASANDVFDAGIKSGMIDGIFGKFKREVFLGDSRIDFYIEDIRTFIEVKCATLEENGIAMFPDAPTLRGYKHLKELEGAVLKGFNAMVVFVAFIDYAKAFTPYYINDERFGNELKRAYNMGVKVRAYRCKMNFDNISIEEEIPVIF